jgi:NADPH:quinone reductase-like Zn-dependent oxidoreductase
MRLRNRILATVAIVLAVAFGSLAIALSYNSSCEAPAAVPAGAETMQGVFARCYGAPEILTLEQVAKPIPADDQLLVRVHAAGLNPVDWHSMRGSPYIMRMSSGIGSPNDARVGVDFAGVIEAVGKNVTRFKPGDAVFGGAGGSVAQYLLVRETRGVAVKPDNITFEQAAAAGVAAVTALQGLRDKGGIEPGQRVLINGASGGVGTFAVQLAKEFGAEVTGVCSTRNIELVRSLGADHVIDYTKEDFAQSGQRYDIVLDNVGNRTLSELRSVLEPDGALVIVGAGKGDWIGPLSLALKATIVKPFVDQDLGFFVATFEQEDMKFLAGLMQAGKLTPVIDRRYPHSEAAKAMEYLETGRARGKVIVNLQ